MPYEPDWRNRPRKPDPQKLGGLIKDARLRLGLTQHEFALKIGVQAPFISKLETGRVKQPSLHFIGPLAAALEMPVAELYQAATGSAAPERFPLPADVSTFARWLARMPETDRRQIYAACKIAYIGTRRPIASNAALAPRAAA